MPLPMVCSGCSFPMSVALVVRVCVKQGGGANMWFRVFFLNKLNRVASKTQTNQQTNKRTNKHTHTHKQPNKQVTLAWCFSSATCLQPTTSFCAGMCSSCGCAGQRTPKKERNDQAICGCVSNKQTNKQTNRQAKQHAKAQTHHNTH